MANISVYHSVPHYNLFALLCLPPNSMKNREFAQPLQVQKNISFPYPFNFTLPGWQLTSFLPFKECKKTSASCSPLYFKQRNAEKQTKYQKAPILVRKQAPSSLQLPSHRVQDRACPSLDALPYLTTGSQVITTVQNRTRINQRAIENHDFSAFLKLHFALQTLLPYRCKVDFLYSVKLCLVPLIISKLTFTIGPTTIYM